MADGEGAVVADLEAGIGTLTRLGDVRVDITVIVVEPTAKSIEVGKRAASLARDAGHGRLMIVANRLRADGDLAMVEAAFPGVTVAAVPDDPAITAADRAGTAPLDEAPDAPGVRALATLADGLAAGAG